MGALMDSTIGGSSLRARILTLRISPQSGCIDDSALARLTTDHAALTVSTSFFPTDSGPIALCAVTYRTVADGTGSPQPRPDFATTAESPHSIGATATKSARNGRSSPRAARPSRRDERRAKLMADLPADRRPLFEELRRWRLACARETAVPPYVVFTDSELAAIVQLLPLSLAALQKIDGVGEAKTRRHGRQVVDRIRSFVGQASTELLGPEPGETDPAPSARLLENGATQPKQPIRATLTGES